MPYTPKSVGIPAAAEYSVSRRTPYAAASPKACYRRTGSGQSWSGFALEVWTRSCVRSAAVRSDANERENRRPGQGTAASTTPPTDMHFTAMDRRRRAAAIRCVPHEWSGFRDPLFDQPRPNLTIESYEQAAQHLLDGGLCPHPDRAALQALWRRQGHSRRLAQAVVDRWGGEVA